MCSLHSLSLTCQSTLTVCREAAGVFDHRTSRCCDDPNCRGQLHDSIINFGEELPKHELEKAFKHAKKVSG